MDESDIAPKGTRAARAARNLIGLVQGRQKLGQTRRPAALEIDVLSMSDQERRLERGKAQRNDELRVSNLPRHIGSDLNFVADALLVDGTGVRHKQDFADPAPQCMVKLALPIVAG